eukprot:1646825-Prymnesium_polylepis.2
MCSLLPLEPRHLGVVLFLDHTYVLPLEGIRHPPVAEESELDQPVTANADKQGLGHCAIGKVRRAFGAGHVEIGLDQAIAPPGHKQTVGQARCRL